MEELYVYALLYVIGFECWDDYSNKLHELFLNNPDNEVLLMLEEQGNSKDAMLHLLSEMEGSELDEKAFGSFLMDRISELYQTMEITEFGKKMYKLWGFLPASIMQNEPFHTLSYADDCLSWGDEKQCRELYEKAMGYYKD